MTHTPGKNGGRTSSKLGAGIIGRCAGADIVRCPARASRSLWPTCRAGVARRRMSTSREACN